MMTAPFVGPADPQPAEAQVLPVMHFRAGAVRSVCCVDESQEQHASPKRHSHFVQLAIKIVDAPPVVMTSPPSVVTVTKSNSGGGSSGGSSSTRQRSSSRRRGGTSSSSTSPSRRKTASPTAFQDVNYNYNSSPRESEDESSSAPSSSPSSPTQQQNRGVGSKPMRRSAPPTYGTPKGFSVRNLRRSMSFRITGSTASPTSTTGTKSFHALGSDDEGDFGDDACMMNYHEDEATLTHHRYHRDHTTLAPQPRKRSSSVPTRQVASRGASPYALGSDNSNIFGGNDPTFIPSRREAAY